MTRSDNAPRSVLDLAALARQGVAKAVGVEPDFTPETLPLVDAYLRQVPADAADDVRQLVAASVGCYFGEVVRRLLGGRWAVEGEAPETWRVELSRCFLYFSPVGMAGEVLAGEPVDGYDGSFATLDALRDDLFQALAAAAPLPEDEYYSLAGRVDVLELAVEWLLGRSISGGEEPPHYTPEDYQHHLGRG